jgi:hypothetical protein
LSLLRRHDGSNPEKRRSLLASDSQDKAESPVLDIFVFSYFRVFVIDLSATGLRVGLRLNFNASTLGVKRIVVG